MGMPVGDQEVRDCLPVSDVAFTLEAEAVRRAHMILSLGLGASIKRATDIRGISFPRGNGDSGSGRQHRTTELESDRATSIALLPLPPST